MSDDVFGAVACHHCGGEVARLTEGVACSCEEIRCLGCWPEHRMASHNGPGAYERRATEIGKLVDRKNQAYGNAFAKTGPFLTLLYPDGMQPAQYAQALVLVRVFDKMVRIATDRDAFGESPFSDIAGYGLLGLAMHEDRRRGDDRRAAAPAASSPVEPVDAPLALAGMPQQLGRCTGCGGLITQIPGAPSACPCGETRAASAT